MSDNETSLNQTTSDPWEAAAKTYKAKGAPSTSAPANSAKSESDPWESAAKTYKAKTTSDAEESETGSNQWYKDKVESALAPTPADVSPDSGVVRSQLIAPAKSLGRELISGGKTAAGLIPSIYHAFADEPTEEEKQQQAQFEKEHGEEAGAETSGLKRIGLGIERMTTAPLIDAAKTYANPATRPTYEQALSVAPEAMGQGAGTVVGGKLIGDMAEKAPAAAKGAAKGAIERVTPSSTLGKIATEEAKNYLIRKIPGHDIYTTAKRIGSKLSEANGPLDATGENKAYAGERAPKTSIGRITTEAPAEQPMITPRAAEAPKPSAGVREYNPEDLDKLDKTVAQLPNSNLQSLGKRLGLDESKYDFSKREAVREGGSKHAVDRDRFTKDTQEKLPGALRDHIIDATNDWEKANPQTFESPARNSKFWADRSNAIISDAVNRWQPETEKPSMPKIGAGAKVKSLGDLSKVTQALMKSLQVSPTKVLEELEGNESQIRTRLLKASAEDLARWK